MTSYPLHVVLIAPFFGENMLRCLEAFCTLAANKNKPVKLGVISQQSREGIPSALQPYIAGHYKINNALDAKDLVVATEAFQKEWGKVDRLIGYLEHLQAPVAEARSILQIHGMKADIAKNFRDKNQMKSVLQKGGLPVAKQAKIKSLEDIEKFIHEVGFPIIVKPIAGVGSKNTYRISKMEDVYTTMNSLLPSETNPVQAEQFILGEEHTLEAVSVHGKVVWQSSTYYLPRPLEVLENPWMQYCVLLPREQMQPHVQQFASVNAKALQTLGMQTGLSHMEWFLQPNGNPIVSEVGARPPGVNIMDLIGLCHNVNLWDRWANLVVHEEWDMPERQFAAGCAFIRHQGAGKQVNSVEGWEKIKQQLGTKIIKAKLPHVGQLRSAHYEGDGWIMVKTNTTDESIAALRYIVQNLHIR